MSAKLKQFETYQSSSVRWVEEIPTHWRSRRIKTCLREVDQRSGTGAGALLTGAGATETYSEDAWSNV